MAYSLIAHASKNSTDNNSASVTIDSTGADLIVVGLSCYDVLSTAQVSAGLSDSNGNLYVWLQTISNASESERELLYYCNAPVVGAGHVISFASAIADSFPDLRVSAWSGAHAIPATAQITSASQNATTTIQPGSITPAEDGCLLIALTGSNVIGSAATISSPFTVTDSDLDHSTTGFSGGMAYEIQTTATARNPTWTQGNARGMLAILAVFKPAAGGGGGGGGSAFPALIVAA